MSVTKTQKWLLRLDPNKYLSVRRQLMTLKINITSEYENNDTGETMLVVRFGMDQLDAVVAIPGVISANYDRAVPTKHDKGKG